MKTKSITLLGTLLLSLLCCTQTEGKIIGYRLTTENGLPENNIRNIRQDEAGYMFFLSPYSGYCYDGYSFRQLSDEDFMLHKRCSKNTRQTGTAVSGNDSICISPDGTVTYIDRHTQESIRLSVLPRKMLAITRNVKCNVLTDKRGIIWISTNGNGLFVYNKNSKELTHLHKNDNTGLLPSNNIVYMTEDRDGNIWLSFEKYGVACLSVVPDEYRILNFSTTTEDDRLNNARILRRLSDGRIVLGNNATSLFIADEKLEQLTPLPGIDCSYISAALDGQNHLWLGSKQNGIHINGNFYGKGRVDFILKDRVGRMWAGGINGSLLQCTLDEKAGFHTREYLTAIKGLAPRVLLEDHKGYLWLGGDKGLFRFHPDTLTADPTCYTLICDLPIRCLFEDSKRMLWAGTAGKGVIGMDNSRKNMPTKEQIHLTTKEGLCNNVVQCITEDNRHYLAFGTENGCSYYHSSTGSILNHYITEHPLNNYYNEQCAVTLPDGRIALGTCNGVVICRKLPPNPDDSPQTLTLTDLYINGASLYETGDSISLSTVRQTDKSGYLQLAHHQNSLTLHFSDFRYTAGSPTHYSYKLEGHDRQWSEATTRNSISYRSLPPGKYTLLVRHKGEDNRWSPTSKQICFHIRSPWWRSEWAVTLYLLIAAIITAVTHRQLRYTHRLKQRIKIEKELTEYKLLFFTNISHEFRTPLTLIQHAMKQLKRSAATPPDMKQPIRNMDKSVGRMLRLVEQLLEFRRMQNNKLSLALQSTNLADFVYNIYISFYPLAQSRKIDYRFLTDSHTKPFFIDRGFVDKMVYNLLSNAFKYTPQGGKVTVRLQTDDTHLTISVEDTGIGISKSKQEHLFERFSIEKVKEGSIGIGLNFIHELARKHLGEISYTDNPEGGSIFRIVLPADSNVYDEDDFMKTDTALQKELMQESRKGFEEEQREGMPLPMNEKNILVVEDDADLADMMRHELGRYFRVSTAANGMEAWEFLQEHQDVALVISDIKMPLMDGLELLKCIRIDKQTLHIPVVLLTSMHSPDDQVRGFRQGADAYVSKPFHANVLLEQCFRLMQQSTPAETRHEQEKVEPATLFREQGEKKFVQQLDAFIEQHISDNTLSMDDIASAFGYSHTKFYNRVKQLTGQTPLEYLKEKRLSQSARLLEEDMLTVSQVSNQTGFTSPQYFATNFKQRFGMTPKEYQKRYGKR